MAGETGMLKTIQDLLDASDDRRKAVRDAANQLHAPRTSILELSGQDFDLRGYVSDLMEQTGVGDWDISEEVRKSLHEAFEGFPGHYDARTSRAALDGELFAALVSSGQFQPDERPANERMQSIVQVETASGRTSVEMGAVSPGRGHFRLGGRQDGTDQARFMTGTDHGMSRLPIYDAVYVAWFKTCRTALERAGVSPAMAHRAALQGSEGKFADTFAAAFDNFRRGSHLTVNQLEPGARLALGFESPVVAAYSRIKGKDDPARRAELDARARLNERLINSLTPKEATALAADGTRGAIMRREPTEVARLALKVRELGPDAFIEDAKARTIAHQDERRAADYWTVETAAVAELRFASHQLGMDLELHKELDRRSIARGAEFLRAIQERPDLQPIIINAELSPAYARVVHSIRHPQNTTVGERLDALRREALGLGKPDRVAEVLDANSWVGTTFLNDRNRTASTIERIAAANAGSREEFEVKEAMASILADAFGVEVPAVLAEMDRQGLDRPAEGTLKDIGALVMRATNGGAGSLESAVSRVGQGIVHLNAEQARIQQEREALATSAPQADPFSAAPQVDPFGAGAPQGDPFEKPSFMRRVGSYLGFGDSPRP